jgi:hypothetical protein
LTVIVMAETDAVEKPVFTISTCHRYFGYLGDRPKGAAIPEECFTCERMLDCMASAPEAVAVMIEPTPKHEDAEKNDEPLIVIEELEGTLFMDKPKKTPPPTEEKVDLALSPQTLPTAQQIELEQANEEPAPQESSEDVCVEISDVQPDQVEVQTHKDKHAKPKRFWNWRRE